ncbi:uncharacterized protein LOC124935431 [Impatiens glandulifera]|uniref:uncharacterized protein LOC124935431 n=1 Tax=Impatiens glandulifera TaxID=253017 RepID=UPI001FB175C9|nr:uncharacterized protein LOC124935431 [Impatiens glandulifera]
MAASPLRLRTHKHIRKISLPSESHPLFRRFDEQLSKLRSSTCSSTLPSIRSKMDVLQDLYDCIDDMFLLSNTQQVFAKECQEKWVEDALDGLLMLLDACASSKNIISETKEDIQGLVSMMRRRRKDVSEFGTYFASRKNVKKLIQKSLKDLKTKKTPQANLDKDQETVVIATMMKEVGSITLALFQSLLSHIAGGSKSQSRWSLVSKLMQNNNTKPCQSSVVANEFEEVDVAVLAIISEKISKSNEIFKVQNLLGDMESEIREMEKVLESLFKRLIKTRVSLLNMHGH